MAMKMITRHCGGKMDEVKEISVIALDEMDFGMYRGNKIAMKGRGRLFLSLLLLFDFLLTINWITAKEANGTIAKRPLLQEAIMIKKRHCVGGTFLS
jgi:hypothetical protein